MSKRFRWLPQARWKRWLILLALTGVALVMLVISLVITAVILWHNPKVQGWVMLKMLHRQIQQPAADPPGPRLSNAEKELLLTNASALQTAAQLFQATNVWDVQFHFTSNEWVQLGPKPIRPVFRFLQPDGSVILRNPEAPRNGLAGVFGFDFPWSEASLTFGDIAFGPVAVRFKGNGTFVNSQRTYKRPLKVDLGKHMKSRTLVGRRTLNFHNLTADSSCLSDTMAYEFFRDAGVPSPRTALARVRLTIEGRFEDRLLGLYVLVENPDAAWAEEQFNEPGVAIFKPVTYELFKDLGGDWKAYEGIYDPKTKIQPKQSARLIALARLMTHASDIDFAQHIGEFIDLDEFARFLACQVILSNYDGLLSDGQNFLVYLDPQTEKFGFIPWDLDQCWGSFSYIGSTEQRERASVWHPWVGENSFLARMLAAQPVRERYRRELERIRETLFLPERLSSRLDQLARVVRPFAQEESSRRLARFDRATSDRKEGGSSSTTNSAPVRHEYVLRRFFVTRAASVSDQLAGRDQGVILTRRGR